MKKLKLLSIFTFCFLFALISKVCAYKITVNAIKEGDNIYILDASAATEQQLDSLEGKEKKDITDRNLPNSSFVGGDQAVYSNYAIIFHDNYLTQYTTKPNNYNDAAGEDFVSVWYDTGNITTEKLSNVINGGNVGKFDSLMGKSAGFQAAQIGLKNVNVSYSQNSRSSALNNGKLITVNNADVAAQFFIGGDQWVNVAKAMIYKSGSSVTIYSLQPKVYSQLKTLDADKNNSFQLMADGDGNKYIYYSFVGAQDPERKTYNTVVSAAGDEKKGFPKGCYFKNMNTAWKFYASRFYSYNVVTKEKSAAQMYNSNCKNSLACTWDVNSAGKNIAGNKYTSMMTAWSKGTKPYETEDYNDGYVVTKDGKSIELAKNNVRGEHEYGQSGVNHYDNKLVFPKEETKEVYIRHIVEDKNGNIKELDISNDNEVIADISSAAPNKEIIEAGGSETKNSIKYQETFKNIDMDRKIIASRSTFLVRTPGGDGSLDAKKYTVTGTKWGSGDTIKDAQNSIKNAKMDTTHKETRASSPSKKVTIIEFYYKEEDIPGDDPKTIVTTNTSSDKTCDEITVETGDKVKPWVKARLWTLRRLKYDITVDKDSDKIVYKLSELEMNKLTEAHFTNINQKTISYKLNNKDQTAKIPGDIFGTSVNNLFDTDLKDKNILIAHNIGASDTAKSIDKKDSLSDVDVDSLIGDFTKISNFTTNATPWKVHSNSVNGLRYAKSGVKYTIVKYDKNNTSKFIITEKTISQDSKNDRFIRVFNPTKISASVTSNELVNHTENNSGSNYIQQGSKFDLKITLTYNHISKIYIFFDFDTKINGVLVKKGAPVIRDVKGKTKLELKDIMAGKEEDFAKNSIQQLETKILIIGVSDNVPAGNLSDDFFNSFKEGEVYSISKFYGAVEENASGDYATKIRTWSKENDNATSNSGVCEVLKSKDTSTSSGLKLGHIYNSKYTNSAAMYNDAYYFVYNIIQTKTLSRIYDFKVTDCTDVNWKNVFRKDNGSTNVNVNDLTNIQYFSGIKEYKSYTLNTLSNREFEEETTIVPLAPYTHATDTSYIQAPKLGYRISFDLKTSGYYEYKENTKTTSNRKIYVTPSYYFISKDGKDFIENIDLYYKDPNGNYKLFAGSNYKLYFTPNNGYRYLNNLDVTDGVDLMAKKLIPLNMANSEEGDNKLLGSFVLDNNCMATSENNFIQSWYGEFKLPNSTIAVKRDKDADINNPLKDGYIGVKFKLQCVDKESNGTITITSYDTPNQNANNKTNTTQWDYEGYLGFRNPGTKATDLQLQLEKGTWNIDNAMYQNIKGTVILYDADNRAANDFE